MKNTYTINEDKEKSFWSHQIKPNIPERRGVIFFSIARFVKEVKESGIIHGLSYKEDFIGTEPSVAIKFILGEFFDIIPQNFFWLAFHERYPTSYRFGASG